MNKNPILKKSILLLLISIILIAVGICSSQPAAVLKKAAAICLECIGIN